MNSIPLFHQLLELLGKSAVLLTATALLIASWRGGSAAQRHALWLGAFLTLLLLPLSKLIAPQWLLPGSPKAPMVVTTTAPVISETANEVIPVSHVPASRPSWRLPNTAQLLSGLWLGGVAALLAYRFLGSTQIAKLRRLSTRVEDARILALARGAAAEFGLAGCYEIRQTTAASVPCTWGVRRPVILLSTAAMAWSETRLLAALRHEFGHIARRDYLTRWLGHVVCALYWPNPMMWFAARSLHKAQEQACDDLVLRAGTPASEYATLLFEAASATGASVRHAVAMARPSTLEGRVLAIVDEARNRRPVGRGTRAGGALIVITALGISALAQVGSDSPQPSIAAPETKTQLLVEAKFIEVPENQWTEAAADSVQVKSAAEAAELLRAMQRAPGTNIISSPRVLTASGERAQIQIGEEKKLSELAGKPAFAGLSMEVVPTLEAGGIRLEVKNKISSIRPGNLVHERESKASVTLAPGQTIVMAGGQGEAPNRQVVVFIEARQITPEEIKRASTPATVPGLPLPGLEAASGGTQFTLQPKDVTEASIVKSGQGTLLIPGLAAAGPSITSSAASPADDRRNTVSSNPSVKVAVPEQPIDISADETHVQGSVVTATGNAEIIRGGTRITGEKLIYDSSTKTVRAEGPNKVVLADAPLAIDKKSAVEVKANAIVLPNFQVKEATLQQAVDILMEKSREADPEKKGLTITLAKELAEPTAGDGVRPNDARLTISLTNIPVLEALKYITNLANARFKITDSGVLIAPVQSEAPTGLRP